MDASLELVQVETKHTEEIGNCSFGCGLLLGCSCSCSCVEEAAYFCTRTHSVFSLFHLWPPKHHKSLCSGVLRASANQVNLPQKRAHSSDALSTLDNSSSSWGDKGSFHCHAALLRTSVVLTSWSLKKLTVLSQNESDFTLSQSTQSVRQRFDLETVLFGVFRFILSSLKHNSPVANCIIDLGPESPSRDDSIGSSPVCE